MTKEKEVSNPSEEEIKDDVKKAAKEIRKTSSGCCGPVEEKTQ